MSDAESATFERGSSGQRVQLEGAVTSALAMAGSHSEHRVPVLIDTHGRRYRLFLLGDNAMEQPTLRALEGRHITVNGTWRNGVVRIESTGLAFDGAEQ